LPVEQAVQDAITATRQKEAELEAAKQRVENERAVLLPRLEAAGEKRDRAAETYTSAREAFDNWVKTRTATGDGAQDADLVSRTRELDRLKSLEDAARTDGATDLRILWEPSEHRE
jgi:outer membrane protein TolC